MRQRTIQIRQFITHRVVDHPSDICAVTAKQFGITPQAARQHLHAMVDDGSLECSGNTKARIYKLLPIAQATQEFQRDGLQEDLVWSGFIKPLIATASPNVLNICGIAASEMINNAIDHSESEQVLVTVTYTASTIEILIRDFGVGVFKKVRQAFNLIDDRQAILELSKGKLTTAPAEHSGYGIFFSSRMVDLFKMWSGKLFFTHLRQEGDWLIDMGGEIQGTLVEMTVATNSKLTSVEVYDKFCSHEDSELAFARTHVPLKLVEFGSEPLVSRSQAKRVLSRFERFTEVLLDFSGIEMVGQGFIDEIFRVFANVHPAVTIREINANKHILQLIHLAKSTTPLPQPQPFRQS